MYVYVLLAGSLGYQALVLRPNSLPKRGADVVSTVVWPLSYLIARCTLLLQ